MSNNPTRILSGDLEDKIRQLIHSLSSFQGSHISLLQRLKSLTVDDLTGDTEAVVQDLIRGLVDSKGTAIERVRQLEKKQFTIDAIQKDIAVSPEVDEYYTYNASGDVTMYKKYKAGSTAAADLLEETTYSYSADLLNKAVTKFRNSLGQKVTITQDYVYNSDQAISNIKTRTSVDNIPPMQLQQASITWAPTATTFKIDWVNPSGLSSFDFDHVIIRLYRADGSLLADSGRLTGANTYTFTGLAPNTDYRFEIVAVDDSFNESPPVADVFNTSTTASTITPPGVGTGQPSPLQTAAVFSKTKHTMQLAYTQVTGETNYHHMHAKVYVYPDVGFSTLLQEVDMTPGTTKGIIEKLEPDMRYKIECYAANVNGVLSATPITLLERTATV